MLQLFLVVLDGRGENLSHQLAQIFHCAGVNEAKQLLEPVRVDVLDVCPIGNFLVLQTIPFIHGTYPERNVRTDLDQTHNWNEWKTKLTRINLKKNK